MPGTRQCGRQLKAVLLLSLVATYPHARTSSYPVDQVAGFQELVEEPRASSATSRERRRSQDPSSMVGKTSCFVASALVATIVVVAVAVAAVAGPCCTESDAAVPGGRREDGRRHLRRSHAPIAIAKI